MSGVTVWLVAFLLYVYDSASMRDREAVLRYSIEGATALLVAPSFTLRGRRFFVPNPLRPDQCDLPLTADGEATLSALDRYLIDRAASLYLRHQLVSIGSLLMLFGLTPVLAMHMNLLTACLIAVASTLALCTLHWIEMWRNRRLLGIGFKVIRSDMLHVMLCPPHAANAARRIAALRHSRYPVHPCLRAFSPHDAEKHEANLQPLRALT